MYKPKAYRRISMLWFVSGVGLTQVWSPYDRQRHGANCEMVAFTPRKGDDDQWADLYTPGYQHHGQKNRVVYLN
ncbi:hypothetical protein [Methylomagnum ishizawai]|uniref:Uncharacterized protein n=1 Tax=Methylomagnum ishizawai TaxID=1760988 RepID=A0A1Y6D2W6_9GAMM|nr:hypothetical protein [Methylomagnum ishizawai]BBL73777.1 hypothetical protein MishRS11D_08750 [Methylomagnum ishizawai]SMF96997.1 hypothetical protein SAMN02949497_4413 [Methylomagnum ishizawai]